MGEGRMGHLLSCEVDGCGVTKGVAKGGQQKLACQGSNLYRCTSEPCGALPIWVWLPILGAVVKLYRAAHIGRWHPNSHDPPSRCTTNPSKDDGHRPKNY
jgi:hypothetical protein